MFIKKLSALICVFLLTLSGNAFAGLSDGLVAYYSFNGNACDSSGKGNNGTVFGATLTTDRFGNANGAFSFNGTSDYIDCGNSSTFNVNHHTICAWVQIAPISTSWTEVIVGKVNPWQYEAINLSIYSPGFAINTAFATGDEANHQLNGSSLNVNQWHFVAMTYDGSKVRFYINGSIDTVYLRSGEVRCNSNKLAIGKHGGDSAQQGNDLFFKGKLDDIRIYNRALSDSEIQQLYTKNDYSDEWVQKAYIAYYGRPGDPGGVEYWAGRLDSSSGNLSSIIDAFGVSQEFINNYGLLSNSELIDTIYQQMFNRDPDAAGKAWYLGLLNSGAVTLQSITLNVLSGAQGQDLSIINNKLAVVAYFTEQLKLSNANYESILEAQDLLSLVDETPASVENAKSDCDVMLTSW